MEIHTKNQTHFSIGHKAEPQDSALMSLFYKTKTERGKQQKINGMRSNHTYLANIVIITILILLGLSACKKESNTESGLTEVQVDTTYTTMESMSDILYTHDFSSIDMDNLFYISHDDDFNENYCAIYGVRSKTGSTITRDEGYIWIGIFDKLSRQPIYNYTDSTRPLEYSAYGANYKVEWPIYLQPVILDDYMMIPATYNTDSDNITLGEVICVDKKGHSRRKRVMTAYGPGSEIAIYRWCKNTFYLSHKYEYYSREHVILYDLDSNELLYEEDNPHPLIDIRPEHKIVSDTSLVDFYRWRLDTSEQYVDIEYYKDLKFCSEETYKIFEKNENSDLPDKIAAEITDEGDHHVVFVVSKLEHTGKKYTKTVELSVINGELIINIE